MAEGRDDFVRYDQFGQKQGFHDRPTAELDSKVTARPKARMKAETHEVRGKAGASHAKVRGHRKSGPAPDRRAVNSRHDWICCAEDSNRVQKYRCCVLSLSSGVL